MKETFMKGGYYKYEVGEVTFVALNTLLWSVKNSQFNKKDADDMLSWLDGLFTNAKVGD